MKKIDILQAYKAMYEFLDAHYHRTNKNDAIGSLLGSMPIVNENPIKTGDLAMWGDWLKAIEKVAKEGKSLNKHRSSKGQVIGKKKIN